MYQLRVDTLPGCLTVTQVEKREVIGLATPTNGHDNPSGNAQM
jgi:hypothetical protein